MVNFYVKVIAHKLEFESSHKAESIKGVREVTGGPAPSQTESLEHQANPPSNIKRVKSLRRNLWNIRSDLSAENIPIHSRSMSDKSISMRHPQSTVKQIDIVAPPREKFFFRGKGNEFVHRSGYVPFLSSVQVSQVQQIQTFITKHRYRILEY